MAAADGKDAVLVWDRPVVCEVCSCDAADSVIVYCCNYGEDHQVGCHTFCLAGHGYRGRRQDTYECLACLDYSCSVNDAVGRAQAGDKASPEFMPELRRVQLGLRMRQAHEAVPHTTEQQRIDQAKAAADAAAAAAKAAKSRRAAAMDADADEDADAEQEQYGQLPSKRRKAAGAASGRLAQGGKAGQRGTAAGAGPLHRLGSGAAAAAAAAVAAGFGAGEEQGSQGRGARQRPGAVQEFIKGVNKGLKKDVLQAQGKAKAAAAAAAAGGSGVRRGAAGGGRGRGRGRGRLQSQQRQRAAAPAAAAEADAGGDADDNNGHSGGPGHSEGDPDGGGGWLQEWLHDKGQDEAADDTAAAAAAAAGGSRGARQQQQQRPQQLAGLRLGRHHKLALPVEPVAFDRKLFDAKLHCRLVVMSRGQQQQPLHHQQDVIDADHYLHVSGVFWANSQAEEEVESEQQAAHRQLLDDMVQELAKGSGFMQGGAFDLSSHPAIQRYMESPHLTYRPLLFIPNSDTDKSIVQDLLSEPRRFVVVSIETKLLVLLPTTSNGMVAICTRRVDQSEALTADVVKTIMAHPGLACPSQDADGAHQQLQSPSESLLGPAGAEPPAGPELEDTKEGVATCYPPAAASPKQQQQEQQHRVQQELSHAAGASGIAGQRLGKGLRTSMRADSAPTAEGAAAALAAAAAARPGAPAARAAAAAAGGGGGGTPSGGLSLIEAVEGSPLAQLLKRVGQGAAAAAGQQQQGLSLQACMPQLADLPEVQDIKLFMLGFPQAALQEGGCLHAPLQAAAKVVTEVHTSTGALEDLLQDLHLGACWPSSLPAAAPTAAATTTAAAGGGGTRAGGRRAANAAGPAEAPREDSFCRVLLVPEHFDSHALQQLLGDVALWQLLASPVAIFKQGPHRGILQELQRLQQQPHAAAAGATSRGTPGRRKQQAVAVRSSSRLPPGVVLRAQQYSDEIAVVADASTLEHCPAEDLQQLLRLLQQAQALLGARQGAGDAAGLAAAGGSAYLVLSGQDLDSLGEQQQELLRTGLTNNTVVLLEDILHPTDNDGGAGTAADHDSDPVVAAAVKLAAQRQQQMRHVVVVAPNIGSGGPPSSGQAQSPSVSGDAAAMSAPAGTAVSPVTRATAAGARSTPAAASKGGRRGAGGVSGGASAQRPPGASYADRVVACCRLQASAQQPRLLAGTLGQALQFLTCLVVDSSNMGGY